MTGLQLAGVKQVQLDVGIIKLAYKLVHRLEATQEIQRE